MTAIDIEAHGYTYTHSNCTFYVFQNQHFDQELLTQLQQYMPGWYPNSGQGQMTICVDNGQGQLGIYQIEKMVSLFTIYPKFMHDASHLQAHLNGIFEYIHALIKQWVTVQLANEIRFKIAFYKPTEISTVSYNDWPGNWQSTKNTSQTICGSVLPAALSEYVVQWSFDDSYQIKTDRQTQGNLWNTPSTKQLPWNKYKR